MNILSSSTLVFLPQVFTGRQGHTKGAPSCVFLALTTHTLYVVAGEPLLADVLAQRSSRNPSPRHSFGSSRKYAEENMGLEADS